MAGPTVVPVSTSAPRARAAFGPARGTDNGPKDLPAPSATPTRAVRAVAVSAEDDTGLPLAARTAYEHAAQEVLEESPGCDLPWQLVAGIGRVETDHGRFGGATLGVDGVSSPLIRGVPLNGVGPVAAIHDTDHGRLDGDRVWDRAVGPMQFIPSTWASAGRDGDGDGVEDPNDLDDAALATAAYLCPATGSIRDEATMRASIFGYNHSDYYVDLVMAFTTGYQTGVFSLPTAPAFEEDADQDDDKDRKADRDRDADEGGGKPDRDKPDKVRPGKDKDEDEDDHDGPPGHLGGPGGGHGPSHGDAPGPHGPHGPGHGRPGSRTGSRTRQRWGHPVRPGARPGAGAGSHVRPGADAGPRPLVRPLPCAVTLPPLLTLGESAERAPGRVNATGRRRVAPENPTTFRRSLHVPLARRSAQHVRPDRDPVRDGPAPRPPARPRRAGRGRTRGSAVRVPRPGGHDRGRRRAAGHRHRR